MKLRVQPVAALEGTVTVPGDKSISHRAVMLGALAQGTSRITGFLKAEDCLSTIRCCQGLGVPVVIEDQLVTVEGRGLHGLIEPREVLDVGNSGTTMRLMAGILAGQSFTSFLTGDETIRRRPMARVTKPLQEMGATIMGRENGNLAPLAIRGGLLQGIHYHSPVASAQIKSALLLAGLYANGWTEITEPHLSRNHTELMLKALGAEVQSEGNSVRIKGLPLLTGQEVYVPGDISSAAYFLVAGLIVPEARITIPGVGLNPTRDGIIEVLRAMGANIKITETRETAGELSGTVTVETSSLQGVSLGGEIIPRLIDEIPVIAVAAAFANGVTEIRDAAELKVKESNRISTIVEGLRKLGAKVEELPDGLRIYGGQRLTGAICHSHHDHRIAMSLAVAGLCAQGETIIEDAQAIEISFPQFAQLLEQLKKI